MAQEQEEGYGCPRVRSDRSGRRGSQSTQYPMSTAVTTTNRTQAVALKEHLNSPAFVQEIKRALPTGANGERLIRAALTSIQKNQKLADCHQPSFFAGLLSLAQLGLIPDGREAHLIRIWNKKLNRQDCLAIPDYKGLVKLVLESGKVSYIHSDVVADKDEFVEDRGRIIKHSINRREPRGPVYAVYAFAVFKDGTEKSEVMSVDEVEAIRGRSRSKDDGPWVTDWNEMAKKTVVKRLSKWLPLSPEVIDAIEADTTADIDPEVTTTVSPPPMPSAKPRKRIAQDAPPPEPTADDVPMDPPPPPQAPAPAAAKPAKPNRLTEVADWLQRHGITIPEVAAVLVDFGYTPEKAVRSRLEDFAEAEITALLENGEAFAQTILDGRG